MAILSFLFYAFLVYLAYKLVFGFILPVYRTTKKIRKGFRTMQEQMHQATGATGQPAAQSHAAQAPKGGVGEYIDFEEVK